MGFSDTFQRIFLFLLLSFTFCSGIQTKSVMSRTIKDNLSLISVKETPSEVTEKNEGYTNTEWPSVQELQETTPVSTTLPPKPTRRNSRRKLPQRIFQSVDFFDKLSFDELTKNREFVELQINCLVYNGPCDVFGRKSRALLPSVILDNCRLCSQAQRNKLSRLVVFLQQNYSSEWRDAIIKYGVSPKFITAGHAIPTINILAKPHSNTHPATTATP